MTPYFTRLSQKISTFLWLFAIPVTFSGTHFQAGTRATKLFFLEPLQLPLQRWLCCLSSRKSCEHVGPRFARKCSHRLSWATFRFLAYKQWYLGKTERMSPAFVAVNLKTLTGYFSYNFYSWVENCKPMWKKEINERHLLKTRRDSLKAATYK